MMLYTVLVVFVLSGSVVCHQDHPDTDPGESTNQKQTSEGSGLSDGLKVGLAIGAGLVAAVLLLLIALCCCLKSRRNSPEESESLTKPTPVPAATKSPVDDNYGLPQHIHYVPYNPKDLPRNDTTYVEMGPPPAATNATQSGDHTTQSGDHAMYEEIKTQDISDEYSEPDKTRTKTTVQMVDNDVYERSGEVKPAGQDNKGFDETGENTTSENERNSVVKMVDNDVYNKD